MIDTVILVCSIYGLAFFIKESDGPWGLMAKARNEVMKNKVVGVFFYKLLDCWFCTGCHAGWIIYLLSQDEWHISLFLVWALAGGVISLIMDRVLSKLSVYFVEKKFPLIHKISRSEELKYKQTNKINKRTICRCQLLKI
jgi:hypothetical protein